MSEKDVREAIANYTALCAAKLRAQKSCATKTSAFLKQILIGYRISNIPVRLLKLQVASNTT